MLPERQAEKAVGTVTPSRVGWTEIIHTWQTECPLAERRV